MWTRTEMRTWTRTEDEDEDISGRSENRERVMIVDLANTGVRMPIVWTPRGVRIGRRTQ